MKHIPFYRAAKLPFDESAVAEGMAEYWLAPLTTALDRDIMHVHVCAIHAQMCKRKTHLPSTNQVR